MRKILPYHFYEVKFLFTGYGTDCRNFDVVADDQLIGHAHQGDSWRWSHYHVTVDCFTAFDRAALECLELWGGPCPEAEYTVYPHAEYETQCVLNHKWFEAHIEKTP